MRTLLGAICVFASSLHAASLAYVDSRDRLVYQPEGGKPVVVDRNGYEPNLRRNGKQLLYTRQQSANSPKRTLVLYDVASGRSRDLISGFVSGPVWSPDGRRMGFTRLEAKVWQVWVMDLAEPARLQPNQCLLDRARRKNSPETANIRLLPPGLRLDEQQQDSHPPQES
jgi:hypothetical protein